MIRPILRYGDRPLHQKAAEVTTFDDGLQRLIDWRAEHKSLLLAA